MKKQEIIITSIIVFGLLIGFIFILKDKNPPQTYTSTSDLKTTLYQVLKNDTLSIGINNSTLDENVKFLDSLCEDIPLRKIVGKSAKLMIFIPQEACFSCFQGELDELKSIISYLGDSNVIEICSGKMFREALAFKKANNLSCNLFFTKKIEFNFRQVKTTMYGILEPEFKIHDVYFPMKSYPEFTKMYIKAINDRYFKKGQLKPNLAS